MPNLTITPNGNMVVAEGATRARWNRRADGSWKLTGIWPDEDERFVVQRRLQGGVGLLVVLEPAPSVLSAFRDELDDPSLLASASPDESIIEVIVPFLDWLPPRYAQRARLFQRQVREQTDDLPAALQPAMILDEPPASGGGVRFAARTPGPVHGTVVEEQICALADYVFTSREARRADESRRPGSTPWLTRLARMIAAGPREPVGAESGVSHVL